MSSTFGRVAEVPLGKVDEKSAAGKLSAPMPGGDGSTRVNRSAGALEQLLFEARIASGALADGARCGCAMRYGTRTIL